MTADDSTIRGRREPPRFRTVAVAAVVDRTPRLRRVTLEGPELAGFDPGLPAASVRLLIPAGAEVVIPSWSGNEFLLPDGSRPAIRTLTPLRYDEENPSLDVEVVLHGDGPLSTWAAGAEPGDRAAVSGTGRGYDLAADATGYLLAGDESALPAISVLVDAIGGAAPVSVVVEIADPSAELVLPAEVRWVHQVAGDPGAALLAAVESTELDPGERVWVAGEAAGVQRIRKHLFEARGLDRSAATVRGYWKRGRSSGGG